jgi:molybdate transport system substrate-binding protein
VRRTTAPLTAGAICLLAAAGCSGGDHEGSGRLVVSAAASLQQAFTDYAHTAGIDAKQSFGGSDELAAQIRQGIKPDVYAAANTTLPDQLYKDGLVGKPVVFATNSLVLAVPDGSPITSIGDLTTAGTAIAIGDPEVPVGSYTRAALERLPPDQAKGILANVRSEEPDVSGIVGKLTQGAVDAGFLYVTDVTATGGALRAIALPPALEPDIAYGAAVVTGAENPGGAKTFIDGLVHGDGAAALQKAGFKPPPG